MRSRLTPLRLGFGLLVLLWSLVPIYWALNVSLTTPVGLLNATASFVPHPFTAGQYTQMLHPGTANSTAFYLALRNSVIEAGGAMIITVVVALFGGYAFARWRFAGSRALFLTVVATLSLPLLAVLIPLYRWAADLGILDTFTPIILLAVAASLPLAVWIMRSFVAALPPDIEAAARIDGAGEVRILWHIVLPLLRPAVAAVGIIVFLTSWSAFLVPVFFTQTSKTQPLTVFVPNLVAKTSQNIGLQAAAACLAMLVPIVVVVLLHRFLVSGLLRGAGK
jgi:multiple sugar transport system permease protein